MIGKPAAPEVTEPEVIPAAVPRATALRKITGAKPTETEEPTRSFSEEDLEDDEDEDDDDDADVDEDTLNAFLAHDTPPAPAEVVTEPEPEPAKPVLRRPALRPVGMGAPAPTSAARKQPSLPEEAPARPALTLPKTSMLAKLKERGVATAVTAGAAACVGAGPDQEAVYTVAQFQEDYPEMPDEWEPGAEEEYYGTAVYTLQNACKRINQLFEQHMIELTVVKAPEPVVREIGALVKLTFMRTKDAPRAYEMLDLEDRATFIKGLKVMAIKRHQTAISRAPRDAASMSGALESMIAAAPELNNMLEGMDFDIDMGAM